LLANTRSNRFDLILCLGVIAHIGWLLELLIKSFNCLRGGAIFILQSSLSEHPGALIMGHFARSTFRRTRHKGNSYSREEIISCAFKAGLELEEVRRYGLCIPFGDRIFGRINYRLEAKYAEKLTERGGESIFKFRKPL
jgi:hypothetical protein